MEEAIGEEQIKLHTIPTLVNNTNTYIDWIPDLHTFEVVLIICLFFNAISSIYLVGLAPATDHA